MRLHVSNDLQGPVEREVDTWIINNCVLGQVFANSVDRKRKAEARGVCATDLRNTNNEPLQAFLQLLTPQTCSNLKNWQTFLDIKPPFSVHFQCEQLSGLIEQVYDRKEKAYIIDVLVATTFYWARYLTSPLLSTYFDIKEQLGVRIDDNACRNNFECGYPVNCWKIFII